MISIVIPNYNKAGFLCSTLQSLTSQTSSDWEAIIVDDGSTDNSIDIVNEYIEKNARFSLLRNETNQGGSVCRNQGLKSAIGDYVIFLDSDDLLSPTCLERRMDVFQQNPENDFLVFPMGTFRNEIGDNQSQWLPKNGQDHLSKFLRHELPWQTMQPIWKRSFLEKLGGFDESYPRLQDVELHSRALMVPDVKYRVIEDGVPDCFYRICDERIASDQGAFMRRWTEGACMYLSTMAALIKENDIEVCRRLTALKGTYISTVNHIRYKHKSGALDRSLRDDLLNRLAAVAHESKLLNRSDEELMSIYGFGHSMGLYRIKGYNFTFKRLITRTCCSVGSNHE